MFFESNAAACGIAPLSQNPGEKCGFAFCFEGERSPDLIMQACTIELLYMVIILTILLEMRCNGHYNNRQEQHKKRY
jgi:hypothetical protein